MELGYDGYPSMQKELQELVLKRLTAVQRMEVAQDRLKNQDVVDAVLEADMEKIRKTQEKLDRKAKARAAGTAGSREGQADRRRKA